MSTWFDLSMSGAHTDFWVILGSKALTQEGSPGWHGLGCLLIHSGAQRGPQQISGTFTESSCSPKRETDSGIKKGGKTRGEHQGPAGRRTVT